MTSHFKEIFDSPNDRWRSNEKDPRNQYKLSPDPDKRLNVNWALADEDMPVLDENDVWMYQRRLEGFIRVSLPDNMNARYIAMLRLICAQARRNEPVNEDT